MLVAMGYTQKIQSYFQPNIVPTDGAGFEVEDILYIVGPITWFGLLDYFLVLAGIGAPLFLIWTAWETSRAMRANNPPPAAP